MRSATPAAVGAVVVTFHPDAEFATRLAAMVREVTAVIIVDNTANESTRTQLTEMSDRLGCSLILNNENRGLAAALNAGFIALEQRGFEWAIAFDQDSTPEMSFAIQLLAAAISSTTQAAAAVVGANWHDEARPDQPSRHLRSHALPPFFRRSIAREDLPAVTCVITSGTLFNLAVWRKLGGFEEHFFLDLVDTDFCLRARAAGQAVRVASAARLRHRRGTKKPVRFAGVTWWPANMPESRLYLLFRNRILVFRRHGWRALHWVTFEIAYAVKAIGEIVFFEERKMAKLSACVRGTWDGLLNRDSPRIH